MRVRPTSVTVIGWFLVVTALCSLPGDIRSLVRPRVSAIAAKSPVPPPIRQAISWLGTAVNLVCGYFLLKGRNWARFVQIGWSFSMLAYGFFTSPLPWMLVIGVAFECVMIYLLFRPPANAFFAAENAGQPIQNELSKRQIGSVSFYLASGFCLICGALVSRFIPHDRLLLMGLVMLPQLALSSILLLIGKLLSPNPNWSKEIGIVLLASAAGTLVLQVGLAVFFSSAEFQKSLPQGKPVPEFSFVSAAIAVGVIAGLGGLLFWLGNQRSRPDRRQARQ